MIKRITNTLESPTKLEHYLYTKLCKMFDIDTDDLDWYEKMIKETLKHFGNTVRLPIPSKRNIAYYSENPSPTISSSVEIIVFEIVKVKVDGHPMMWLRFKGFEKM